MAKYVAKTAAKKSSESSLCSDCFRVASCGLNLMSLPRLNSPTDFSRLESRERDF